YGTSTSIAVIPHFHFKMADLSSLSKLLAQSTSHQLGDRRSKKVLKISFLAAVLEVDGPIAINIKRGPDRGNAVSLVKLIVADGDKGTILPLTAWRETADVMTGLNEVECPGIKRGDVVVFHNVLYCDEPPDPQSLVASPKLKSSHQVCYRTLPTVESDKRVTPDLRLGSEDFAVQRVAEIARWLTTSLG
ncbi:hypothetical protein DL93DRAFT_2054479, partial [Clavulina sp. PMI_390]